MVQLDGQHSYNYKEEERSSADTGIKLALKDSAELLNPLCLQIENDTTDCHCAACLSLYVKTAETCSYVRQQC